MSFGVSRFFGQPLIVVLLRRLVWIEEPGDGTGLGIEGDETAQRIVRRRRAKSPGDRKLSDCGGRRAGGMVGGKAATFPTAHFFRGSSAGLT